MYPNRIQKESIRKTIDACRFVYNWALETKKTAYEKDRTSLSWYDLNYQLTKLKTSHPWLKEANSQSLQQAIKRVHLAFQRFFQRFKQGEEKLGYPKFKSRKRHRQSFDVPQFFSIDFSNRRVRLPKIGKIKTTFHRQFIGTPKTSTVISTTTGKVFICIVVEDRRSPPKKLHVSNNSSVGIDVGLTTYVTLSSGVKIGNPRNLQKALKRLQCLHSRLSRKKPRSKNWEKARQRLACCYEHISNQRKDFQHKLSTQLIRENQAIMVESLHIPGIVRNRRLAKAVSDAAWSRFLNMLKFKAEWNGVSLIKIGSFEPTSKRCHLCGHKNNMLTLSDREWTCSKCFEKHDRDVNAAQNIKKIGLRLINSPREPREEPVDQLVLTNGMKQETLSIKDR